MTWIEYTKQIPLQDIIGNSYLITPFSFYDETDQFLSVFLSVEDSNYKMIFEIDLMSFMLLHDLIGLTKKNKNQQCLLKEKYPFGKNDLEINKDYSTKELSCELYACSIKNKCGSELIDSLILIINNKIYFGQETQLNIIGIKSKYSLTQMELQVDRAEPRMLSLFCFSSKDKIIEKNCLFKDVETTIRVKRNLEEHIRLSQYKEDNLFIEYFNDLSKTYA